MGHFEVGFGAKKYAPQVSLGILFLACQLVAMSHWVLDVLTHRLDLAVTLNGPTRSLQ